MDVKKQRFKRRKNNKKFHEKELLLSKLKMSHYNQIVILQIKSMSW